MGTFDALNTSLSSLYAQRRGMDVVGQNVANANTDNYTRQRVAMQSVGAATVPAIFSTWNGTGAGVTVASVERMRDTFLELRAQSQHASVEQGKVATASLADIEKLLGEPSDTGLQRALAELWSAFGDIANAPQDLAARSQLLQRATAVTDWMHGTSGRLDSQWSAQHTTLNAIVREVNTAATSVAQLNEAIRRADLGGSQANELADQRDALVMRIAELSGAESRGGDDGSIDLYVGGTALVRGGLAETLAVSGPALMADAMSTGTPVGLVWPGYNGQAVTGLGGRAAGLATSMNDTLPQWQQRLDQVASSLVTEVNAVHTGGFDLDGLAGGPLLSGSTTRDIAVAVTNPRSIAAAATPGTLDGTNAAALADLALSATGPDTRFRQLVTDLAVSTAAASNRMASQNFVLAEIDGARESQAGVDIDEEMTNMLAFQRAYEGASRMLTAVDQMLDQLINRTGLVGR